MPRFDKLEFGDEPQKGAPRESPAARDDRHWLNRAAAERQAGHYENALRYYSRALELDKALVSAWVGQVQMLCFLDEAPEADLWGRKALEIFPNNGELLAARSQALCRLKDLKQAQACSDGSLRREGQSALRWQARGELLVAMKQDTDAHCFDKALQIDKSWLVPTEIALAYLYYKTPTKALARARTAVERGGEHPYPWYVQGLCQMQLGLSEAAGASLDRCLQLSPRHAAALALRDEVETEGWSLRKAFRRLWGGI